MKSLAIIPLFAIILLTGCTTQNPPSETVSTTNNPSPVVKDKQPSEGDGKTDATPVEESIGIRDSSTLPQYNALDLYLASPLWNEKTYQTRNESFIETINEKREMGGRLDSETGVIESTYIITQPIASISIAPVIEGDVEVIEVCTPDGCTSLLGGDAEYRLVNHFTKENPYFVGPNYYLIRIFTDGEMYHQLLTLQYYDINNLAQDAGLGIQRKQLARENREYNDTLQRCYEIESIAERDLCVSDAKQENTISLSEACTYNEGTYTSYLDISSDIALYAESMSWMREGDMLYYVVQHSDSKYVGCENEDHALSFHRVDCADKSVTEIKRITDFGGSRLSYCGIQLAGVVEDDMIVYGSFWYEGPYCSTAERYNVLDTKTQESVQVRILPENVNGAKAAGANFILLDENDSKQLYDEIAGMYNQTIGNVDECGAGQYTISGISGDVITIEWIFGTHRDEENDTYYTLSKQYTLKYQDGILNLQ